jgi:hypothetical protein
MEWVEGPTLEAWLRAAERSAAAVIAMRNARHGI